jgi:hypothetical protein
MEPQTHRCGQGTIGAEGYSIHRVAMVAKLRHPRLYNSRVSLCTSTPHFIPQGQDSTAIGSPDRVGGGSSLPKGSRGHPLRP